MTITLPDTMRTEVETKAHAAGYPTIDEYIVALITEAEEFPQTTPAYKPVQTREELEVILIASLDSGAPVVADNAFWEERARRHQNLSTQKGTSS